MSLKERVYSVLIVSAAESFNDALSALLPEAKYSPVCFVSSISAAKRAYAERAFDYVIINSPLPDDIGTRFAIDTCNAKGTVVLLYNGRGLGCLRTVRACVRVCKTVTCSRY